MKYLYDINDLKLGKHRDLDAEQVEIAISVCDEMDYNFAEFGMNGYFICGVDYPTPTTMLQ